MHWPIIIILMTGCKTSDGTVSSVGFLILSAAVLIYRYKRLEMNDKLVELAVDVKQALAMLFAGGAATLTATNVISLFGMVLSAVGLVFLFLNWRVNVRNSIVNERERKRANDLKERELDMKDPLD